MIKKYIFDCNNNYFSSDPVYNFLFLKSKELYYDDCIKLRGFIPLYEVLKDLGFKPTVDDLKYVLNDDDGHIHFGLNNQMPKKIGRPRKKFVLTFDVRPIE